MSLYDELAITLEAPFKVECGGLWFWGTNTDSGWPRSPQIIYSTFLDKNLPDFLPGCLTCQIWEYGIHGFLYMLWINILVFTFYSHHIISGISSSQTSLYFPKLRPLWLLFSPWEALSMLLICCHSFVCISSFRIVLKSVIN